MEEKENRQYDSLQEGGKKDRNYVKKRVCYHIRKKVKNKQGKMRRTKPTVEQSKNHSSRR